MTISSQSLEGLVTGLHHITLVTSNEATNRRFYTEVLGLRRVKLSVNQDDVFHRHLFYADDKGTTGSAITFFEWPDLPPGAVGLGSPHHLSYRVRRADAIAGWVSWLGSNGVKVSPPIGRGDHISVYLKDPDGVTIEITAQNEDSLSADYLAAEAKKVSPPQNILPEMRLLGFDHASPITSDGALTKKFFEKFLGLKSKSILPNPDQKGGQITAIGNAERPEFLRYLGSQVTPDGFVGEGSTHHIAMAVEEDADQLRLMRHLDETGIGNSGIIDRFWFKSLYFRDPDGNLLEVATKKPGYTADEGIDKLGTSLVLPKWLEPRRAEIEARLKRTDEGNAAHSKWPPVYRTPPSPPEEIPTTRREQEA
ncbi:MAG: VOC family protein [Thaumarchaeota archaeon]|nr:VOC family protein [Nitrososphaerota archaeon]